MSKIYRVRKAFHKIYPHIKNHEISCIFFNNDLKILSTLPDFEYTVDHSILYHTVQNIKCSSITNFSKIIEGLEEIDKLECKLETTSIIISDGYHTVDDETNISLQEITQRLRKRFDHSIGLGNEVDKDLLEKLSKNSHEVQNEFMFSFLNIDFFSNENNFIHIPENTFFVSLQEYRQSEITETRDNKTFQVTENGSLQDTFQYTENIVPIDGEKKHYIFVIDISGSMDDTFNSRLLEDFYQEINYFYQKTNNVPLQLSFYDEQPMIMIEKQKQESVSSTTHDEIFTTCKEIHEMENGNCDDISEKMYEIFNRQYENSTLRKFIKKKYNELVSPTKQKLLKLFHSVLVPQDNNHFPSSSYEPDMELCPLCFIKPRTILFSCSHLVCCLDCIEKMIELNKLQCPLCRTEIQWLRKCQFVNNSIKCTDCENTVNIFQHPCQHVVSCFLCHMEDTTCRICHMEITKKIKIII